MGIHPNIQNKDEVKTLQGFPILCPYCRVRSIERKDWKNGNYFCEHCGFITKEIRVIWHAGKPYEFLVEIGRLPYKKRNINSLRRKYEKKTNGTTEYRIHDKYKTYLGYVAGEFGMTKWQHKEVLRDIIKANGVNLFCKRCDYKTIIMAMCIYLMRADKRDIRLDEHRLITASGLNEKNYIPIIERYSTFKIRNR